MARIISFFVVDGEVFSGERRLSEGDEVRPQGSVGFYRLEGGKLVRYSGKGLPQYTFSFTGDGEYKAGPSFAHKVEQPREKKQDEQLILRFYRQRRRTLHREIERAGDSEDIGTQLWQTNQWMLATELRRLLNFSNSPVTREGFGTEIPVFPPVSRPFIAECYRYIWEVIVEGLDMAFARFYVGGKFISHGHLHPKLVAIVLAENPVA